MFKLNNNEVLIKIYDQILLAVIIIFGFISRAPALDKPLNEFFAFRQTQTAWGAKGLLIFEPREFITQTPVFGPPFKVPFEFPLYQWTHFLLVKMTNFDIDFSGRLLSSIIFQLVAIQIYFLVKKTVKKEYALYSIILFELTPFGFQWSTAVLIDYMSILFIVFGMNLILRINNLLRMICGVGILFILASLVKITSFIICLPVVTYLIFYKLNKLKKSFLVSGALIIIPIYVGNLWTNYADTIKGNNYETAWLTSKNLSEWNFGTLSARFDPNVWSKIFNILDNLSLGFKGSFFLIVTALVFLLQKVKFKSSSLNFLLVLTLSTFLGPLIFINLYFVHDYYFIPISVLMSMVVPGMIHEVFKIVRPLSLNWVGAMAVLLIIFNMWMSPTGISYYNNLKTGITIPNVSLALKKYTTKDEMIVVVNCNNWDPTILYYADRRGYQFWSDREPPKNLSLYNAILKCDETTWSTLKWINLTEWIEVESNILVRKDSNVV